jgi:hypothetical protein
VARGSRPPSVAPSGAPPPLSAAPSTHPSAPPPANNASTTVQTVVRPGSKPPPLPPGARSGSTPPSKDASSMAARTLRGVGGGTRPADPSLEKEIDASLSALDAFEALDNGPTGTSLPDEDDTSDRTGETQAPSTQDGDMITSSHVIDPHTMRNSSGPAATERTRLQTDPSIITTTSADSAVPAPLTVRGDADAEDPTGSSGMTNDLLESTHSGPTGDEEEIVIADDLAEIVDDSSNKNMADENTDAGTGTVPPYRSDG